MACDVILNLNLNFYLYNVNLSVNFKTFGKKYFTLCHPYITSLTTYSPLTTLKDSYDL